MITDLWTLGLVLFAGHFLCDFALQGPYMSETKNPYKTDPTIPSRLILIGHASIHGAFVAVVTGYPLLGFIETYIHWVTDSVKCKGVISFRDDQLIHLFCKFCYILFLALCAVADKLP